MSYYAIRAHSKTSLLPHESATTITLEVSANVCVVRRKLLNFGFWFATQRNGLLAMSSYDVICRVRVKILIRISG